MVSVAADVSGWLPAWLSEFTSPLTMRREFRRRRRGVYRMLVRAG